MVKDGFYNKETKQFPNDGGRLYALMEIPPLQVVTMDMICWVQKLLTLKQATTFLAKFYFYFFFYAIHSLLLDFTIWRNFTKKETLFGRSQCDKQIKKQIS
jgi:hypothetical protein